jgi:hypothetical protein
MRFFLLFTFIFLSGFLKSQQNEDFLYVKQYYDGQRVMISDAFKSKYEKEEKSIEKTKIFSTYTEFMSKLDSIQNKAYLAALIKVKNKEDLQKFPNFTIQKSTEIHKNIETDIVEIMPEYPGGISELRKQFGQLFYSDFLSQPNEILKAVVTFVVEKDGSISTVQATGENFSFNRQAEITTYILPGKFSPAKYKGMEVRYRFRLPISMQN